MSAAIGQVAYLIGAAYVTDDHGVRRKTESRKKVRAQVSGTRASEFFEGGRAGLKVSELVFTIPARKYGGEEILEYGGKRLSIYRTYPPATDLIELHCEQKGGTNGNEDGD